MGGVGANIDHAQYIGVDAGLFEGFADGCLGWCLADLRRASGRPCCVIEQAQAVGCYFPVGGVGSRVMNQLVIPKTSASAASS